MSVMAEKRRTGPVGEAGPGVEQLPSDSTDSTLAPAGARAAGFAELLERLGFADDDHVVLCHKPPGGKFRFGCYMPASQAPEAADQLAAGDVWFGVNQLVSKPPSGRGTTEDVGRLAALYADLDVDPGKLPTYGMADAVIDVASKALGSRPVAVIESGHGLQPIWAVDSDDPAAHLDTPEKRADAALLLRRFGGLVAHIARQHGGKVDTVYDLARVLRVPGTVNYKELDAPVPTGVQL
jgi:hypothetical protein